MTARIIRLHRRPFLRAPHRLRLRCESSGPFLGGREVPKRVGHGATARALACARTRAAAPHPTRQIAAQERRAAEGVTFSPKRDQFPLVSTLAHVRSVAPSAL